MVDVLRPERGGHQRRLSDFDQRLGKPGTYLKRVVDIASLQLDKIPERPFLPRRSSSLRRQSSSSEKTPSYFNLPLQYVSSESLSPPPPYFSPPLEKDTDDDKRWIHLLERQNTELMDQLTKLSSSTTRPTTGARRRPVSFHGAIIQQKDRSPESSSSIPMTNTLVQRQMLNLREELDRTRRRCAELSEIEAARRGLELRCLGLERVVEELMAAIEFMKTQSKSNIKSEGTKSATEPERVGIKIESHDRTVLHKRGIQLRLGQFFVHCRRKFIPYQLRAVILVLLARWKSLDLVEQLLSTLVIVIGTVLNMTLALIESGKCLLKMKSGE